MFKILFLPQNEKKYRTKIAYYSNEGKCHHEVAAPDQYQYP
jgi:hypothetical protein